MKNHLHVGIDVGSTTIKIVIMDDDLNVLHEDYQRHYSDTKNTLCKVLTEFAEKYKNNTYTISLTGSGATGMFSAAQGSTPTQGGEL